MSPPTPEEMEALRRFVRRHAPPCDTCGGCATVELVTHAPWANACDRPECRTFSVCEACGRTTDGCWCVARTPSRTVLAEVRDLPDAVAVRWAVRP